MTITEGEWVKCEELWIGKEFFRGTYDWFKSTNFSLDSASTGTLITRLAIPCTGQGCYGEQFSNNV